MTKRRHHEKRISSLFMALMMILTLIPTMGIHSHVHAEEECVHAWVVDTENATVNIETNKFNYDFKCRDCGEVQSAAYRTNREAATECVQAATCILPEQTRFTYVVSIAGHVYVSGSYTLEAIVDTKEALGHDWDDYAGSAPSVA